MVGNPPHSGVERYDADRNSGDNSIKVVNGRLILNYSFLKDTEQERNDFSAPMPGPNRVLRIVREQDNRLVAGLVYRDTVQLNITGADQAGLVIETLSYMGCRMLFLLQV